MSETTQARYSTKADVCFLVDSTGSMQPCIDALLAKVEELATSLEGVTNVNVDWRAKVIGYRDLEEDSESDHFVGKNNPFVMSSVDLKSQISMLEARGGGPGVEGIPESALEAIEHAMALQDWQAIGEAHRIIVLLTDAPTKESTITGKDANDLAQTASEGHFRILGYGPSTPEYLAFDKVPKSSFTDVAAGAGADVYEGLKNLNWKALYDTLAKSVSVPLEPSESGSSPTQTASPSPTEGEGEADDAPEDPADIMEVPSEDDLSGGGTTQPAG